MDGKIVIRYTVMFAVTFSIIYISPRAQWKGIRLKNSWIEIQQERRERVWSTCSRYPELKLQKLDYRKFYYSREYALLFCAMGKVGSTTTFLTTFKQILDKEEWTEYSKG